MSFHFGKLLTQDIVLNISKRYGHHLRGKSPAVARSIEQRLAELNKRDPKIAYRVDIGYAQPKISRSTELTQRLQHLKQQRLNNDNEKLARNNQLKIDLSDVTKEWNKFTGPHQIRQIADHYGVYEHLFGDAFFTPRIFLNITYEIPEENADLPVYFGNVIKPSDAQQPPNVSFDSDKDSLWTLVLTNPDGHFTKSESEYVHWFIGNIPGGNVNNGETIVNYLQPFPPRGVGFQRFIFILYKQEERLNFEKFKKDGSCLNLEERTFSTLNFYRELQDKLTPVGLAFFQSDWDASLTNFYHNTLSMKEPIFEYDFPPPYIRPQKWFPLRQPFNVYMDKYRDPKKIAEEYLIKKLKKTHPFRGPEPPLPYPNAQRFEGYIPSWLKTVIRKDRLGWGRINDFK